MFRLVFFASNNGSAMRAVYHAISEKTLDAEIALLVSNKKTARALAFAQKHHIPTLLIDKTDDLISKLFSIKPDLILLSGYLKKIPAELINANIAPIINTHPALLPKFGGKGMFGIHVHRAVIKNKQKLSGATLHLVNEQYDQGPIIAQHKVPVYDADTPESLAQRVQLAEARLMINILKKPLTSSIPL